MIIHCGLHLYTTKHKPKKGLANLLYALSQVLKSYLEMYVPTLPLISARTFRSWSFTFWAFFSASWQMVGALKVRMAILKKIELHRIYGTLLNSWVKEARNYSSYELALFYEFSRGYSMVHRVCLCYLCQFHLKACHAFMPCRALMPRGTAC